MEDIRTYILDFVEDYDAFGTGMLAKKEFSSWMKVYYLLLPPVAACMGVRLGVGPAPRPAHPLGLAGVVRG